MTIENAEFVNQANPHSWFLVADNLHAQAVAIYRKSGTTFITNYRPYEEKLVQDISHKSVFLLAGFAIENAIKGFLVYENPNWVADGRLSKHLRSHSLTKLKAKSKLIPNPCNHQYVLETFEEGLSSWARYPCALSAIETKHEQNFPEILWADYLELMRSYGIRMIELLAEGWEGPYGDFGRFDIEREFFVMCSY